MPVAVKVPTSLTGRRERVTTRINQDGVTVEIDLPWDETESQSVVVPESQAACVGGDLAYRAASFRYCSMQFQTTWIL